MNEIEQGNPDAILDIALLLRTLLTGKIKNGGRLLFKCAEEVGIVPVCYLAYSLESQKAKKPPAIEGMVSLQGLAKGLPSDEIRVQTDLSTWLEQTALYAFDHKIAHWKLIREVADNFGAHADTNSKQILRPLMSPHDSGIKLSILLPQFRQYGALTLQIAKIIIHRAHELS